MQHNQHIHELIFKQVHALTKGESDLIANLSNTAAVLFNQLDNINWAGFYLTKQNQLVLGPFQGQPACIRIDWQKGVCGTAAATRQTLVVDNVHEFEGHIACDAASNSEIVIPIMQDSKVVAVLDIDSPNIARFSELDKHSLEKLGHLIESFW